MSKFYLFFCVLIALVIASVGYFMYDDQHRQIVALSRDTAGQSKQLGDLRARQQKAQGAGKVDTSKWERYCDAKARMCFQYPNDWALEEGTGGSAFASATVTSPDESAKVTYQAPMNKENSNYSARIVDVQTKTIASAKLKIVGSYPVSAGVYQPSYAIENADTVKDYAAGKVSFGHTNPRFAVGKQTALSLNGAYTGDKFGTPEQVEAWFKGINAKTMVAILQSFSTK